MNKFSLSKSVYQNYYPINIDTIRNPNYTKFYFIFDYELNINEIDIHKICIYKGIITNRIVNWDLLNNSEWIVSVLNSFNNEIIGNNKVLEINFNKLLNNNNEYKVKFKENALKSIDNIFSTEIDNIYINSHNWNLEFKPSFNQGNININTNIEIIFNELIFKKNIDKYIYVYNYESETIFDTINLNSVQCQIFNYLNNKSKIIINLNKKLEYNSIYYIIIEGGIFYNTDNNFFKGINKPKFWQFSTTFNCLSHTFTNIKSSYIGPNNSEIIDEYYNTSWANSIYSNIQGIQEWNILYTGIYNITVWGASGGFNKNSINIPGGGNIISGDFLLNKNDKIYILVGNKGDSQLNNGGGGGGTFILKGNYPDNLTPLIIAGGGGGSGDIEILNINKNAYIHDNGIDNTYEYNENNNNGTSGAGFLNNGSPYWLNSNQLNDIGIYNNIENLIIYGEIFKNVSQEKYIEGYFYNNILIFSYFDENIIKLVAISLNNVINNNYSLFLCKNVILNTVDISLTKNRVIKMWNNTENNTITSSINNNFYEIKNIKFGFSSKSFINSGLGCRNFPDIKAIFIIENNLTINSYNINTVYLHYFNLNLYIFVLKLNNTLYMTAISVNELLNNPNNPTSNIYKYVIFGVNDIILDRYLVTQLWENKHNELETQINNDNISYSIQNVIIDCKNIISYGGFGGGGCGSCTSGGGGGGYKGGIIGGG